LPTRVFFSFHYQDVSDFRANVVRNRWCLELDADEEAAKVWDNSIWEATKKQGPLALKRMINPAIDRASVTCVLAGTYTYARPWVRYELLKSYLANKHLMTVHINSIPDKFKQTKPQGPNPLSYLGISVSNDGWSYTILEWLNGSWRPYVEIDSVATRRYTRQAGPSSRGRGFQLSQLYRSYDWVGDNGYDNFCTWIK
jgi:hypothetical protein